MIHQFMALVAVDIDYHSHTTSVVLVFALVETLFWLFKFTFCHIILVKSFFLFNFECKIKTFCYHNKGIGDFFNLNI